MELTYDEAVAGWAAHLRAGGTTPWGKFHAEHPEPTRGPTPNAVALELVRRLNAAAGHAVPGLADLVLTTPSPGRGRVDVPLPWSEPRRFGTPPMDPGEVPAEELVRLLIGVLSRILPGVPPPEPEPDLTRWPVPWRRRFRLYGAPQTVAAIRRGLLAQGLVETDYRPVHVVVARPVDVMMAEHWSDHSLAGGNLKWSTIWRRAEAADELPRRLEVTATAGRLAVRRVGRRTEPVHLVVARTADEAAAQVARILRARSFGIEVTTDAAATDLTRRVNRFAEMSHGTAIAHRMVAALGGVLDGGPRPVARPPGVPPWSEAWAHSWAAARGRDVPDDYAVHGDLADLAPLAPPETGPLDRGRTLEVGLAACLSAYSSRREPA